MSQEHGKGAETKTEGDHPIFLKDPSDWLKLVHTQVSVTTEDGKQHEGWVYTVDPVSESIVLVDDLNCAPLCSSSNSTISVQILMGVSVTNVESLSSTVSEDVKQRCDSLFRPAADSSSLSKEEIVKRRTNIKNWLEKHRIPVSIGGYDGQSLSVLSDALVIQPPFTEDSCLSTNEIILSKVQGLIKAMPKA